MAKRGNPNIRNIGFGSRPKEVDDEYRSRIKGVPKKRRWTKEICVAQLEEIMDIMKKRANEDENLKDLEIVTNKMMDIIKYLYPPVQQSVNVNIDTTAAAVLERLKNWKEKEKEKIILIEEDKDNGRIE